MWKDERQEMPEGRMATQHDLAHPGLEERSTPRQDREQPARLLKCTIPASESVRSARLPFGKIDRAQCAKYQGDRAAVGFALSIPIFPFTLAEPLARSWHKSER
jgi:hypothetical protein